MRVSKLGMFEIAEHEAIVPGPYLDSVGVWTWGIGHTAAAGGVNPAALPKGMPSNVDAALVDILKQFKQDLRTYENRVNDAIKVKLKQHEFDALVSFDLNTGGIYKATLTRRINAGDPKAADSFMGWLRPPEIRSRRTDEMNLFKTGDYNANGDSISIWKVSNTGRLRGVFKVIKGNDLLL